MRQRTGRIGVGPYLALLVVLSVVLLSGCFGGNVFSTTVWAGPLSLANGAVVLGTRTGQIVAINPEDGSEFWSYETKAGRAKLRAVYGTPASDGERVYAGGFDGVFYALSLDKAASERVAWTFAAGSPFVGGPAVTDGLVLAASEKGALYALEAQGPRAGEARWTFSAAGKIWAAPAVAGDLVYVSTLAGTVHAVRLRDDPATGKKAGQEAWQFKAGAPISAAPVIVQGVVYVGSFDRNFYALDAATGDPRWLKPFEAKNWFWAEPLVHEGRVYAPSLDHNLYILNAQTGAQVQEPVQTGGAIRAAPVLVEGRVVIANEAGETWWVDLQTGEARPGGGVDTAIYAPLASVGSTVYIYAQDGALYTVTPKARQPARLYPTKRK
ncbi:MAG: PQQ-binding-like beta-propeller repeat protein [Chloroflexi bacterium]|nr:PQQ-binding-like beta-propeller repeat protein [Chloroflexota bacterium]